MDRPLARPLYAQVKDALIRRLVDADWKPGQALPNEFALAAEYGVSQGTMRRALDELAQANLVVRRQGKGTFVAEHTRERAMFHFLHLETDSGQRAQPESRVFAMKAGAPTREEARRLELPALARVVRLSRVRLLDGAAAIVERIALPGARFPGLEKMDRTELPNELYALYQSRWGVSVARAVERLKAVPASAEDAGLLGVTAGTPLLEIDRLARALDGRPCELRLSRCLTARHRYVSELV
ncbi:MAG: GntR family transcriptional regulator [Azospirillum sp.]|nr:GntR family transcriptional regulator [Azospirillum sp.]